MKSIEIRDLTADSSPVKVAIFDFDGTISTLRCGWEQVMEAVMLERLKLSGLPEGELLQLIRDYIDESTGIQTIFQMEWLAQKVEELCHVEPLDPWDYKDEYNAALLAMVNRRIHQLETGEVDPSSFFVRGSREFLELLKSRGVEIYIASGTDDVDLQHEAGLLGVTPLVSGVKGAPHRKKDCSKAAVIRDLMDSRQLSGKELMVVGDGKVEICLGNEVGAVTVGVATRETNMDGTFHPKKLIKLRQAEADYIVADFDALIRLWNADNTAENIGNQI